MTPRRIILTLLAVALVVPVGLFVRQQRRDAATCEREFGRGSTDWEICTEYGASPEGMCTALERQPFSCSEGYIAGHRKLMAARHAGLYQVRLDCAAANQDSLGTPCSPEQWDRYCSTPHGFGGTAGRCRAAGPVGREGVPPAELEAKALAPVGPLSGPRTECGTLTTYERPGLNPGSVAVDADGSVWFTEPTIGALSHMTTAGKITRQFLWTRPGGLTRGPGGHLWFATKTAIWQRSPSGETRRYAAIPAGGQAPGPGGQPPGPFEMVVSPDGSVWFLQSEADRLGRISPDGTITDVPLRYGGDGFIRPTSLTVGPDGSIWANAPLGRRLARVDGRTLAITQFPVGPSGTGTVHANSLAADADGNVWFEQSSGSGMESRPLQPALGRMDRTGGVTLHPLPSTGARWPESLTAGPDGAIWFLDPPAKTVGRMAPDGTLTEFPFAQQNTAARGTMSAQLAAGSKALWFTEPRAGRLGLITCQTR